MNSITSLIRVELYQKSVLKHVESDNAVLGPGIMQKMDVICGISITVFDY